MLSNNLVGRIYVLASFLLLSAITASALAADRLTGAAAVSGTVTEGPVSLSQLQHGPLTFVPNRGQWDQRTVYRADVGGASIWYTRDAVYFQLSRHLAPASSVGQPTPQSLRDDTRARIEYLSYALHIENANPAAEIVGESPLPGRVNYLIGNQPRNWRTDVPMFQDVVYRSIYPGIDLRYHGNPDHLEYDFELTPGADPKAISLRFEGIRQLSVRPNGELLVSTDWGDLVEQPPRIYQPKGDKQIAISGAYAITRSGSLGFKLGNDYDPSLPAVIDPVLTYSTYLGGAGNDIGRGIVADSNGAAFIIGQTESVDFPTIGAYDASQNGSNDVFITKLSANGQYIEFSTFIGGAGSDDGTSIALTPSGKIVIAGHTMSTDFPALGAFDLTPNGGTDAFVAELVAAGNSLVYAGYLGGSGDDRAWAVACDTAGRVYLAGETSSPDLPSPSGYDAGLGGTLDGFVARVSTSGASLEYGSYLGGSDFDGIYGIAVDKAGSAYLAGFTNSSNFPTVSAYDPTANFGYDVFVAKLSPSGGSLTYGTFLGGTGDEWAFGIALDGSNNMFITGLTTSNLFPAVNAFDPSFNGIFDAFVTQIASGGTTLSYSSFLGGANADYGQSIAVQSTGEAVITG
ncbi:MAG: SBBP repeat-containing protein, partial [candidate division Zixibacteria bacterium]|nr:SBBP repeat-containing protein [candidate division Zixibacteria bacterium]